MPEEEEENYSSPQPNEMQVYENTPELRERAIVLLSGTIDQQHLALTSSLLEYHYREDFNDPITLLINSPGGSCSVGWSIVDIMNFIKNPVHTVAIGVVASMAADIFINGDQRILGEHSTLMIHPHSSVSYGSYSRLLASQKSDDIEHDRRVNHYLTNSKYTTKTAVEENLFSTTGDDLWLTPEDVMSHGLADEIARSSKNKRRKTVPRRRNSSKGKSARKTSRKQK